jgi:ABC-type amino acid transport system permease subunit
VEQNHPHLDENELRVTTTELLGPNLQRLQQLALGMLVAGAVLCAVALVVQPLDQFWAGYLVGYVFWLGITSGCFGLLMLHHTVGGGWGFIIRRMLEAGTRMFPVMGVLALLIIAGLYTGLYAWNRPDHANDPIIQSKWPYLTHWFFILRLALYFAFWLFWTSRLNAWGRTQDEAPDPAVANRLNVFSAAGILVHVLVITFVAVDLVMSLDPHWFSSIFGLLFSVKHALSAMTLMLVLVAFLGGYTRVLRAVPDGYFRDLGNLTLAMVLLWAYMSFSQYLIIYSGNLTEEVPWYLDRQRGAWMVIPVLLVIAHFAYPFLTLLVGDKIKRNPHRLARLVAGPLLFMQLVDTFWMIAPTFTPGPALFLSSAGSPLLIGGIWLFFWVAQFRDKPVVPLYDPRFMEGIRAHAAHHAHAREVGDHA